jgi:hypothetical protein
MEKESSIFAHKSFDLQTPFAGYIFSREANVKEKGEGKKSSGFPGQ